MFTRRRAAEPTLEADGTAACPLCGTAVEIAADGRCRLGHQVVSEEHAARHLAEEPEEVQAEAAPAPIPPAPAAASQAQAEAVTTPPPGAPVSEPDAPPRPPATAEQDAEDSLADALARLQAPAADTVPLRPVETPAPRAEPSPPSPPSAVQPARDDEPAAEDEEFDARTRLLEAASWFTNSGR